jgi:hypothetical protein
MAIGWVTSGPVTALAGMGPWEGHTPGTAPPTQGETALRLVRTRRHLRRGAFHPDRASLRDEVTLELVRPDEVSSMTEVPA